MNAIEEASEVLKNGGLVIYPTETVFGLGCVIGNQDAIARLYEVKHRDPSQPTSIIVASREMAEKYADFSEYASRLADKFWPGPLTMCLQARENVPSELLGPNNTIGIRVPSSKAALELVTLCEQPLLAPSANFKGEAPPTKTGEIDKKLADLVDYVVDIDPEGQKPSTVIIFDDSGALQLLREGPISEKVLLETLEKGL